MTKKKPVPESTCPECGWIGTALICSKCGAEMSKPPA